MNRAFLIFFYFLIALQGESCIEKQNKKATEPVTGDTSKEKPAIVESDRVSPVISDGQCVQIISWNIANLGKSKTDVEIDFMADLLADADIAVIQEVVAGNGGAQAVARLADALNRRGAKWDYIVSDPTTGDKGVERYAYLWKPKRVKLKGRPWLEPNTAESIDREPFMARFIWGEKTMLLANLHAVPKNKYPNIEIEQLKDLPLWYPEDAIILMGDCNASNSESGGEALVQHGFKDAISGDRTTLKMKPDKEGRVTANAYDHIYYESKEVAIGSSGVLNFSSKFSDLKSARLISDHIPVWACLSLR